MLFATMLVAAALLARRHPGNAPVLWFLLWAAFVLAVLVLAIRQHRKRREAFAQLAMELGFLYLDRPDETLAAELAQIRVVEHLEFNRAPSFRNVLQGSSAAGEVIIADRTTGSGKARSTSTIVAFKSSTAFPAFMVAPETVLWHVVEKFGFKDIDIESAREFSRRFFLHGDKETAVRALFKPEVILAFEQLDPSSALHVSGSGSWLTFSKYGRLMRPQEIRGFLETAETLAGALRRAQTTGIFRS